jgi:cytochrome c-type biogenesis protein CcmH
MMFWILVGVMSIVAVSFVVLPIVKPNVGKKPIFIASLAVLVPLIAIFLYQKNGSPSVSNELAMPQTAIPSVMPGNMNGAMPSDHPTVGAGVMNMDLDKLADKLAEKLKANPDNSEGWALLARTYVELKKHKESLPAFEHAASLLPKDPSLMADYADALAMSNQGKFANKSEELVDQALKLDPMHVKALMLKATIAFNRKDYVVAIDNWKKLLTVQGLDAETTKQATGSIEEAQHMMKTGS